MAAITLTDLFVNAARRGWPTRLASRAAACVAIAIAATATLLAHDPGLSALDVRIDARAITAVLSLAAADARTLGRDGEFLVVARDTIELRLDGQTLSPSASSVWSDESGGVHARLAYDGHPGAQLIVRSGIVSRLPRGHRELLTVRTQDGTLHSERMLDGAFNEAAIDMTAFQSGAGSSFARFFRLGVQHILTGYDHLLFLAAVLVVLRRWRDVIQTITAFTAAHSITLALATTGVLLIPGRVIEPLIAASIVFVGIENLVRAVPASRWKLTFGFGLVHGLGFATVLRDLGVGGDTGGALALPLAAFNAGVEAGQMLVASLLIPAFWWIGARQTSRARFAAAWSVLVVAIGSYWFLARIA